MFLIKLKMWISIQDFKEIITQMSVHHFGKFQEMTAGWIRACPRGSSSLYMLGANACATVPPATLENCPEME